MNKTLKSIFCRLFCKDGGREELTEIAQTPDNLPAPENQGNGTLPQQETEVPPHNGMTDQILETLRELGFRPEPTGSLGYSFQYEGANFLYMPTDDENLLKLAIPCIYEADDDTRVITYCIMNLINRRTEYAKACIYDDYVWLFYAHNLFEGQKDLKAILSHMIPALDAARILSYRTFEHSAELLDSSHGNTTADSEEDTDDLVDTDTEEGDDDTADSDQTNTTNEDEEE